MAAVFALALVEHLRQVWLCYRQVPRSTRQWLTLCNYTLVACYVGVRGPVWALAPLAAGIAMQLAVLYTRRPLLAPTCLVRARTSVA